MKKKTIFADENMLAIMNKNKRIIGREYEQKLFESVCGNNEAKMVAVYGRRRVGKTFLIKEFFNNKFDFMFTGSYMTSSKVQLSLFQKELQSHSKTTVATPKNWFEAFAMLKAHLCTLRKERIVVFLDELPWMDTPKSNFLSAFSYFWNNWASSCKGLKLFICGSSTTWMMNNIIGSKGGLYNRCSLSVYLSPFTLGEMEQMLTRKGIVWTRHQIAEAYMIFGGIPYYVDLLDKDKPFSTNIDDLFFRQGAPLRNEYEFLFRSLFKEAVFYRQIVEALATSGRGMTQQDIKDSIGKTSGGSLTKALKTLIMCDFIRSYSSVGKKTKEAIYQLTDLFTLFHLRFVARHTGQDEHFWSNLDDNTHDSWAGYAFERVCLHHITQIKKKIGITGVLTNAYSWRTKPIIDKDGGTWNGAQIDLILDRADNVTNICEVKYSKYPYSITAAYDQHLRERMLIFKHHTKSKSALHLTFITTYGLVRNAYYNNVQSEVVLDDLFE